MFQALWPDLRDDEVPIGSITNGVHGRTWASARVDALLTRVVGEDWPGADAERWAPCPRDRPGRGVGHAERRPRRAGPAGPPAPRRRRARSDVLTVGFARRFATYKRATLLLSDPTGCGALLLDTDRPVQFVFAGKAHPADTPGKELIQRIEQFARSADVRRRFVFLADYDISIARAMYHGCDVWLNTPRRPLEACGTSGMKAALNGALNCSILDGWWDECYDGPTVGRSSRPRTTPTCDRRDLREAGSLFSILEQQVVRALLRSRPRRRARASGSRWCCRPGPRSARRSPRRGWSATTRPTCTSPPRRRRSTCRGRRQAGHRAGRVARAGRSVVGRRGDHVRRGRRHGGHRRCHARRHGDGDARRPDARRTCGWRSSMACSATTASSSATSTTAELRPAGSGRYHRRDRGRRRRLVRASAGIPVHPDLASRFDLGRPPGLSLGTESPRCARRPLARRCLAERARHADARPDLAATGPNGRLASRRDRSGVGAS